MDKNTQKDQLNGGKVEEILRVPRNQSSHVPLDGVIKNSEKTADTPPDRAGEPSNPHETTPPTFLDRVRLRERTGRKRQLSRENRTRGTKKVRYADRQMSFDKRKIRETRSKRLRRGGSRISIDKRQKRSKEEVDKKPPDCLTRFGKNFYYPTPKHRTGLRPIYIDGSNIAFSHGQNECFSVEGLKICIDYFKKRGHEVKAFVPHFRLRRGETTDQTLLHKLVSQKQVITTPTLYIQNQRRNPYDDWYIVQTAAANGGIIISSDNYQDIIKGNPNLRSVIEEYRLVPTFVDDMLIFPVDPHGNRQNNLEQFLRF